MREGCAPVESEAVYLVVIHVAKRDEVIGLVASPLRVMLSRAPYLERKERA